MNKPGNVRLTARLVLAVAILQGQFSPVVTVAQTDSNVQIGFTVNDLLDVVNVSVADVSNDGRWVAATAVRLRDRIGIDNNRFGDPTYYFPLASEVIVADSLSGSTTRIFPERRHVRGLKWSPDATRIALVAMKGDAFEPLIWDRASGRLSEIKIPDDSQIAENADLHWSPDGEYLVLALRKKGWQHTARERFDLLTQGPIIVHSSKEPFLSWESLRRMASIRGLAVYEIKTGRIRELLPELKLSAYDLAEDGSFVRYHEDITQKTDYDVIFGTDNQVRLLPTDGGDHRVVIKSTRGINVIWSRDGRCYAYSREGNLFAGSIDDKEARQLTGEKPGANADKPRPDTPADDEKEKSRKEKERFNAVRLNPSGELLVASNKEGFWLVRTVSGEKDLFLKMNEEDRQAPRYQAIDWTPDGQSVYFNYSSRTTWERGVVRYDVSSKRTVEVYRDSRLLAGVRLSKHGSTFIFGAAESNRPLDLYAADAAFKSVRRLTELNPQLNRTGLAKTELITYLDADGKKTHGVLYYPVGYQEGVKYPAVFNIYEQFFDDGFNGTINILTANGYAVMQPSVNLEIGAPGEAWVKGVTAAANKLIEMGIADAERLGVQGTSYGGYATNLLITQTNRFKAAINISGKVNMVSFYTDSPRLGVRNIHAPEKSQDRIGATLWQQPQKYISHSAIMHADRIKTPLLLITGEQDHNVPARQALEMFYGLRRLGKRVEWVNYVRGGHGMPTTTVEEVQDYHRRILAWYEEHLKGESKKPDNPEN